MGEADEEDDVEWHLFDEEAFTEDLEAELTDEANEDEAKSVHSLVVEAIHMIENLMANPVRAQAIPASIDFFMEARSEDFQAALLWDTMTKRCGARAYEADGDLPWLGIAGVPRTPMAARFGFRSFHCSIRDLPLKVSGMMSSIQSWHLGASTQDEGQVCVGVGREKLCASLGRDLLLQREVWYGLRLDSPWNVEDTRRDGCRMLQLPP